ncbi:unnamed protein product [Urochloa humidicola]
MASPKLIALFLAFAMAAAAVQPSETARVQAQQGLKTAASSSPEAEKVTAQAAGAGVPSAPTSPGLPAGQLPPGLLPAILGILFPPLGGIIGLLQPLLPPPAGSPPQQGGGISPPGATSPPPPPPAECMTPLSAAMPCMDYLTNITVLTPPGECCDGIKGIIREAPICLCHGMNGGMNQFLPNPVDPLRMAVLPLVCGTMMPIQTLLMCNSNQVPPIMPPTPATPTPVSP